MSIWNEIEVSACEEHAWIVVKKAEPYAEKIGRTRMVLHRKAPQMSESPWVHDVNIPGNTRIYKGNICHLCQPPRIGRSGRRKLMRSVEVSTLVSLVRPVVFPPLEVKALADQFVKIRLQSAVVPIQLIGMNGSHRQLYSH